MFDMFDDCWKLVQRNVSLHMARMARLACELEGLEVLQVASTVCSTTPGVFHTIVIWCQVMVIRDPPVLQIFEQLSHVQSLAAALCMLADASSIWQ